MQHLKLTLTGQLIGSVAMVMMVVMEERLYNDLEQWMLCFHSHKSLSFDVPIS